MILTTQLPLLNMFIQLDGLKHMLSLLNHENIDIKIDVINFFDDLIDQDLNTDFSESLIEFYQYIVINLFKDIKEFRGRFDQKFTII